MIKRDGKVYRYGGPFPCLTYTTLRDLLDAKGVSWKFYAVAVQKESGCDHGDTAGIWSAFDAIKAVRYSPEWHTNVTRGNTRLLQRRRKAASCPPSRGSRRTAELRSSGRVPSALRTGGHRRHGPVVGRVDRQRDRREPVLEVHGDRRRVGRLGRFLRSRARRRAATTGRAARASACRC